ncbi:hypothetical protein IV454_19355 [Massilia antarctica]|uniref:Uncharacterized protein n=1 Tax=Massilia antarctica TaxID=2765360 RepID=A0AA49A5R2_9BURK|nr:hypothetical protein [Massilia antarctica]QPI47733.1 hypothetical protein IV454_19355 [Massilia antarctica]
MKILSSLLWMRVTHALVIALAASLAHAQPIVPAEPGAFLMFLCQASDNSAAPHAPAYYQELFDPANPDMLDAYFKEMSFGKVSVKGSRVFGWFRLNVNSADLKARSNPTRHLTLAECIDAGVASLKAQGTPVDPSQWAGTIAIINVETDAGSVGNGIVGNAGEVIAFFQHEMIHAMGLNRHTHNLPDNAADDHVWGAPIQDVYNDPWDIMSFNRGQRSYQPPGGTHGFAGPTLNMAYRSLLNWVPAGRIANNLVTSDRGRKITTYNLIPVSEPQRPGTMAVVVALPGDVRYLVEYHRSTGYDRAVVRNEVVVREWRADQDTYLVRQTNGHIGYFAGEAPFIDTKNSLSITVQSMGSNGDTATVSVNTRLNKRQECQAQCRRTRDQCISDSRLPGHKRVQQCVREYAECLRGCSNLIDP